MSEKSTTDRKQMEKFIASFEQLDVRKVCCGLTHPRWKGQRFNGAQKIIKHLFVEKIVPAFIDKCEQVHHFRHFHKFRQYI